MPHEPLAYFITMRGNGTRLYGDERGSMEPQHRAWGSPPLQPNPHIEHQRGMSMKSRPIVFDAARRALIGSTIAEVCEHRSWELRAVNVRTNHVHAVVAAAVTPEQVMSSLKSWSTRRMVAAGVVQRGMPVWSRHGSTRYLWTEKQVDDACAYVVEGQGAPLD
jgi:REP element-mobilizing transposase RayT